MASMQSDLLVLADRAMDGDGRAWWFGQW